MSRSATIIAAYLIKKYQFPKKKAEEVIRNSRSFIKINKGFDEQLLENEHKLK